ncbi:MAG: 30S ribosome-binding factor RbfA [Clostridia bacterium]|nr:30S ribosome-binding factor RbfA [Clostridia bacterium]MBR3873016.1 30S ribosome-binding factor RbfA [Clostridia bacterium]
MSYQRIDRISEEVRRVVDQIIRERVSDPRVKGTFSVTRADVTRDLRYAKIYVSILEEENREPMMAALRKAAGFVRHELRQSMIIRYAPEILFELDNNIEYGIHIASVLKQVHTEDDTNDENDDDLE